LKGGGMILRIDAELCCGCGVCVDRCALDTLRMDEQKGIAIVAYPEDCMTCFTCEIVCPAGAVYVDPRREPLPAVVQVSGGAAETVN